MSEILLLDIWHGMGGIKKKDKPEVLRCKVLWFWKVLSSLLLGKT